MTTQAEIGDWFDRGVALGATHMIVVCDTFSHDDYPVFVRPDENAREVHKQHDGVNMQRVMEVYDLASDRTEQLSARRVFNLPEPR